MELSKDDPIYYRNKIYSLIKEAQSRDIKVSFEQYLGNYFLSFKDEGTTVSVNLSSIKEA